MNVKEVIASSRANGLYLTSMFYVSKKPCKRGHRDLRYVSSGECRECRRLWKQEHREKINKEQNLKRLKQRLAPIQKERRKELRSRNMSAVRRYNKDHGTKFVPFVLHVPWIPLSDEATIGDHGELLVRCYKCGEQFPPNRNDVYHRRAVFLGTAPGEGNFYCSDTCKTSCPVFGKVGFNFRRKKRKPKQRVAYRARSCNNKTLKQLQCDEAGHNHCERCGDIIDVELHHTLPVAKFGPEAISPSGHILLCKRCHILLHKTC